MRPLHEINADLERLLTAVDEETGELKIDKAALEAFLLPRYRTMPRTMLRYAIEKFPEGERKEYLSGHAE